MSLTLILILSAVIASCTYDLRVGPERTESAISLGKIDDAPPMSGPRVLRVEDELFLTHRDGNLFATFGIDAVEICLGGFSVDVGPVMIVLNPRDAQRVKTLIQADDIRTDVFDLPGTPDCPAILAAEKVYSGLTDLVQTDNDLFAGARDNKNHNAFGIQYHGRGINGHSRCVWDGNDLATMKCNDKINIR